ncbi:MAG: hypothetical protein HYZ47_05275, partial [Simkania negevensis]|nr:hypothetical protein [Simkania negevensis]
MLFLRKNLKNLSDFSLSEKRPLFWLLLAPFLFLLSLLIALPCSSRVGFILPFLSFIGFLAILRFKLKGLFLSLSGFVFYISFDFFFHTDPFFLWRSCWGLSLCATLVLSLVSFEEIASYY